jgi:translation initiation factor IF-2
MAEEKMMRLSQAARKLNVSIVTITEILSSKGQRVDNNPNAKLASDQLEILAKELNAPDLLIDFAPAANSSAEPMVEPSSPKSDDQEILYFREKEAVEEPEKIKIEHSLQGTTVLGKIDLNAKPSKVAPKVEVEKPKPVVIEEPIEKIVIIAEVAPIVTETPVVEAPKPEPIISTAEVKPEPVEETKPTPVVLPDFEEADEDEEFEPIKPVIKKPIIIDEIVDEVLPPKLIKAQGDKLAGLKVLGKIELPVERKPLTKEELKLKRKRKRVIVGEKVGDSSKSTFENNRDKKFEPRTPQSNMQRPGGAPSSQTGTPRVNAPGGNTPNTTQNNAGNTSGPYKKGGVKSGSNRKDNVSTEDVKDNIKSTISRMQNKSNDFGSKYRKEKRKTRAEQQDALDQQEIEDSGILKVTEYISAAELASLMDVSVNEVIASCMKMGIFASINQRLDAETIQMIGLEFNFDVEFISAEEEVMADTDEIVDKEEDLLYRAPIVTIMGHVDHGKTSLLDYIRKSKVVTGEAGGITQHIGAYSVKMTEGANKGKSITFLDTPGHEAFTAMRARGAKVTDIVIIVISADDSVMPQTKEAINHAQNAGVPIVFALNKIDKVGANPQKIREDLSKENILVESWGGKYQEQEVSAKSGLGIDELLDKVLLEAEILELKANPNRQALGTVIEASLDKGRGYVSTILVQTGTLKVGDIMLAGQYYGRVRAMVNDMGERIQEAIPSQPVQLLGLPGAPQAGDKFNIMETDREARDIANKREQLNREQSIRAKKHITLDEIGRRKAIGTFKELNVIVKGDVDGSVEALSDSLLKLSTDEVQVRIVHKAVGQISESDVTLASAADAIVIGFQVRPSNNARKIADAEQIEIRLYSIIYDAINEIKSAMEGLLAPKVEEVITGNIIVREVFKISKLGTVAGSYVTDGFVKRNNKVRIIREGIVVHEGEISQLKRFKDDVAEVKNGYECGLSIKNFNDILVDDIIESFEIKELKRTL